ARARTARPAPTPRRRCRQATPPIKATRRRCRRPPPGSTATRRRLRTRLPTPTITPRRPTPPSRPARRPRPPPRRLRIRRKGCIDRRVSSTPHPNPLPQGERGILITFDTYLRAELAKTFLSPLEGESRSEGSLGTSARI